MTRKALCSVLFVLMARLGIAQLSGTASLTGKVVHGQTNAPLGKVSVTLEFEGPPKATAVAITNGEGKYAFDNLPPGQYRLFAMKQGFRRIAYGAKDSGQVGAFLKLDAADARAAIDFKLPPTASISGTVTEADGEIGPGFEVTLLRQTNISGKMELAPFRQATSDQRGVFRFSDVQPGRYYVAAVSSAMRARRFTPSPDAARILPLTTLYPGTRDSKDARSIDVRTGDRVTGIDFAVQSAMSCRPKARVVLPTGIEISAPPQLMFSTSGLFNRGESFGVGLNAKGESLPIPMAIPPGSYNVWVNVEAGGVKYFASTQVELAPGEESEITLTPKPLFSIPCAVKFDGVPAEKQSSVNLVLESLQGSNRMYPRANSASGTDCRFNDVSEGNWKVRLYQVPEGIYLKALTFGQQDVLNRDVAFHETPSIPLTIVLGSATAEISGEVEKSAAGEILPAVIVLSSISPGPDGLPQLRTQVTDASGKFHFRNLPPGNYRAYAMEEFDGGSFRDVTPLEAHSAAATEVRLANGTNPSVTLKRISAQ